MGTSYLELGFTALRNGDFQEALNIFRRSLETEVTARAYLGLGTAFKELGDLPAARWGFAKAMEKDPRYREAEEWLERLKIAQGPKRGGKLRQELFRAGNGYLESREGDVWHKLFLKGVNLGLGLPGFFPGEYPITKGTYLKWFRLMSAMGINAVRIYTVHPPSFYEALDEHTKAGGKLLLLQGIWLELPHGNNFAGPEYQEYVQRSIRDAVDAIYGNAELPVRPGLANGMYDHDVSSQVAAFLIGREWESCAVKEFNQSRQRMPTSFSGRFLKAHDATPFECWVAQTANYLQEYETDRYGMTRPVSVINWPTLDPLDHPSESRYEDGLRLQGLTVNDQRCNENEDVETFDSTRIKTCADAGFFATYHVYPYYPDFMNNDYPTETSPYLSYLQRLKQHHGRQPILVAEFGVPSSREISHWQRQGWHHGGHDEQTQGAVNSKMALEIYRAGMAGAVLFSWFDEWFKRNWLFLPYELPAERKPRWFNLQDAEQNYGVMAAYPGYPGKKTTLSGRLEEWRNSTPMYDKTAPGPIFRFGDGGDGSRTLLKLQAQHDEGFFYLRLETAEAINFARAHYLLGLNTCGKANGEHLIPFQTNAVSPVGLSFLLHLAGRSKSRILVCRSYDKYLNADTRTIAPMTAAAGEWVTMLNQAGGRRISRDGRRFFPSRVFSMSNLRYGSLDQAHPEYNSLADFFVSGTSLELRIPWSLINIADPSSHQAIWFEGEKRTATIDGIGVVAYSYSPSGKGFAARRTAAGNNLTDSLPLQHHSDAVVYYRWDGWQHPVFHTYLKQGYYRYKETLSQIPETIHVG